MQALEHVEFWLNGSCGGSFSGVRQFRGHRWRNGRCQNLQVEGTNVDSGRGCSWRFERQHSAQTAGGGEQQVLPEAGRWTFRCRQVTVGGSRWRFGFSRLPQSTGGDGEWQVCGRSYLGEALVASWWGWTHGWNISSLWQGPEGGGLKGRLSPGSSGGGKIHR